MAWQWMLCLILTPASHVDDMQVDIEPFTVQSGNLQARLLPLAEQLVVNFRTKIPEAAAEYCTSLGAVLFRTLREMRREPGKLQQHADKLALLQQLQVLQACSGLSH